VAEESTELLVLQRFKLKQMSPNGALSYNSRLRSLIFVEWVKQSTNGNRRYQLQSIQCSSTKLKLPRAGFQTPKSYPQTGVRREAAITLSSALTSYLSLFSHKTEVAKLFLMYINVEEHIPGYDIDDNILSKVLKFADDTKLISAVATAQDITNVTNDLHNLASWSDDWMMLFNTDKCHVLHLGRDNSRAKYCLLGKELSKVADERDLGVIVQDDLKVSKQCTKAVSTAYRILGLIRRTIECKSQDIILQLYKSLVRPHLEYCVQCWNPYYRNDVELIEKVQR